MQVITLRKLNGKIATKKHQMIHFMVVLEKITLEAKRARLSLDNNLI